MSSLSYAFLVTSPIAGALENKATYCADAIQRHGTKIPEAVLSELDARDEQQRIYLDN